MKEDVKRILDILHESYKNSTTTDKWIYGDAYQIVWRLSEQTEANLAMQDKILEKYNHLLNALKFYAEGDEWDDGRVAQIALEREVDYTKMSAGEMLTACGDNAAKWAQAFCQIAETQGLRNIDEGWMLGWFASAIEQSTAVRQRRQEKVDNIEIVMEDNDEVEAGGM